METKNEALELAKKLDYFQCEGYVKDAAAKLRSQAADIEQLQDAHRIACKLIAEMHEAALGCVTGPIRGVVADTLRVMSGSAFEEAMAFGISTDSFERLARTVNKRAISAAPQPPQKDSK